MGDQERRKEIPEAPIPTSTAFPGNLLSSVAPPIQLPNFVTTPTTVNTNAGPSGTQSQPIGAQPSGSLERSSPEVFSPVIPLSKGEPTLSIRTPDDSQATTQSPTSLTSTPEVEKIGDVMPGSILFSWVKGAVSSGGILQKVAEKAKSSVDSVMTTLDPQMKEYLNSGGDIFIVVASDKEVKVAPIREAFQAVFGKATVVGYAAQSDVTACQPVGYASAYAAAKQRIASIRASRSDINNNTPIIAVENYLYEAISDRWYDVSLVVLAHPSLGVELQAQSQATAVPAPAVAALRASTPPDYPHGPQGFSATLGAVMADNLQVHHTQWHEAATGVSRKEIIQLAAKSLAGSYKRVLAVSTAEI